MSKYTIAIDAMGGDDVPAVPVEAGVIAARVSFTFVSFIDPIIIKF